MSNRLPTVEALRAFGAISVLWMHCIWLGPWDFPRGLGAWFHHGWLGVDLFLIISGFATTRALFQGQSSAQTQSVSNYWRNYWRNRLARIYPLYLLTCVVFLLLIDASAVTGPNRALQIISHLTLTHGWFIEATGAINGVTWTLTLEIQLYVAGFFLLLTRFGASSRYRVWLGVALFVFLMAIGYRYGVYYLNKQNMALCLHWISQLPGLCEGFFLGVLIAKHAQYRSETNFVATATDRRRTAVFFASGLLSSIVLVILLEDVNKQYWDSWQFPTFFRSGVAISFALVVWAAVRFDTETRDAGSKLGNVLQTIAGRLGAWSYGIYLWHLPVLLMLKKGNFNGALLFLLTLSITVAVAAASYRWFEQPCMQWARRRGQ